MYACSGTELRPSNIPGRLAPLREKEKERKRERERERERKRERS